jgi:hypothetical protein
MNQNLKCWVGEITLSMELRADAHLVPYNILREGRRNEVQEAIHRAVTTGDVITVTFYGVRLRLKGPLRLKRPLAFDKARVVVEFASTTETNSQAGEFNVPGIGDVSLAEMEDAILELANEPGQEKNVLTGVSRFPTSEELAIVKHLQKLIDDLDQQREAAQRGLEALKEFDQEIGAAKRNMYVGDQSAKAAVMRRVQDLESQKRARKVDLLQTLATLSAERQRYVVEFERRTGPLLNKGPNE